jgi:predicted phosphodiesterase
MGKIRSLFGKSSSSAFQILSDLHLEAGQQYPSFEIPPSAPYLILAGDIGRLLDYEFYLAFLAKQTAQFEKVFLVLGNHEFYGLSFSTGIKTAQKLESEPILSGKLILLHQKRFDVPNSSVTLLGCTLWSRIRQDAKEIVQMKVSDFKKIEGWTPDTHNAEYESDVAWLRGEVQKIHEETKTEKGAKRKILIVTHHAPSTKETAAPEHVENPWSSAFSTDLITKDDWTNVKIWIFGHTHFTTDFGKFGVRVFSNQRGYVLPGSVEKKITEKDKTKVYDVKKVVYI